MLKLFSIEKIFISQNGQKQKGQLNSYLYIKLLGKSKTISKGLVWFRNVLFFYRTGTLENL